MFFVNNMKMLIVSSTTLPYCIFCFLQLTLAIFSLCVCVLMMAKSSFSPLIPIPQSAQLNNLPSFGVVKLRKGQFPLRRRFTAQIRSSRDQVFEDHSNGIICYRDSNGEIICEGLDEGPCLRQQFPLAPSYLRRDAEIVEILQQKWLEIVESGGGGNGAITTTLKDSNCNGFNTLC